LYPKNRLNARDRLMEKSFYGSLRDFGLMLKS